MSSLKTPPVSSTESPKLIEAFYGRLGLRLRHYRELAELSQDYVAKRLGFIDRRALENIEKGRTRLKLIHAIQICDIYEINLEDLLDETEGD